MKFTPLITSLVACLIMGCANIADITKTLGSPQQVQTDVTILGTIAKPKISSEAQARIHQFASYLNSAASLDTTELTAMIPKTGSANADALISAAVAYLNATLAKYGSNNPTTIAYMHAVANGLLANF
jgi:hypothetical protein